MQDNAAPRWSPARLAYGFYTVAATGAVIGQTWVAYTHVPWPSAVPAWARIAAVLPFALCLELLAMALAASGRPRAVIGSLESVARLSAASSRDRAIVCCWEALAASRAAIPAVVTAVRVRASRPAITACRLRTVRR